MNAKVSYNPTKGVKSDFTNLLAKFSEKQSVRYECFAELWKSLQFSYLYSGRKSDRECREFFEEVNVIALSFHLPPYDVQVRVGGLYILYAIFCTQPCLPKVQIRVTSAAWKSIQDFQNQMATQQHFDVLYIFQKLFHQHAFQFVSSLSEVYLVGRDKQAQTAEEPLKDCFKGLADSVSEVFTPDVLQQLQAIHRQYQLLKLGVAGPGAVRPDRSLDVVEDDILQNIEGFVQLHKQRHDKIIQGRGKYLDEEGPAPDMEDDTDDPDYVSGKSTQSRIKARAFSKQAKQSRSRRHRAVLTEDVATSSPEKTQKRGRKRGKKRKYLSSEESLEEEMEESHGAPDQLLSMPSFLGGISHSAGSPQKAAEATILPRGSSSTAETEISSPDKPLENLKGSLGRPRKKRAKAKSSPSKSKRAREKVKNAAGVGSEHVKRTPDKPKGKVGRSTSRKSKSSGKSTGASVKSGSEVNAKCRARNSPHKKKDNSGHKPSPVHTGKTSDSHEESLGGKKSASPTVKAPTCKPPSLSAANSKTKKNKAGKSKSSVTPKSRATVTPAQRKMKT